MAVVLAGISIVSATGQPISPSNTKALFPTQVYDSSPLQGIVALQGGHNANIQIGDKAWIFLEHKQPVGGIIFFVSNQRCACRLNASLSEPVASNTPAVIARRRYMPDIQTYLPIGLTIYGKVTASFPDQQQAWINLGRFSGLRKKDNILIRRKSIPIARGEIVGVENEKALLTFQPMVRNALPRPDDTAELWPAPGNARSQNINTYIIAVRTNEDGRTEIVIPGTAADGFSTNRFANAFRNGRYIGAVLIEQIGDPLSVGRWIPSLSCEKPQAGDEVILRPPPDTIAYPLSAAVFRIDDDGYCLVATGEQDNIKHGETFIIRRPKPDIPTLWQDIAALNVTKLNVDYSAGYVHALSSNNPPVQPWNLADRLKAPSFQYQPAGKISAIQPGMRSALVDNINLQQGEIVRWVPSKTKDEIPIQRIGAGLIVGSNTTGAILYVPPGWGDVSLLPYARIDRLEILGSERLQKRMAPATRPASAPAH